MTRMLLSNWMTKETNDSDYNVRRHLLLVIVMLFLLIIIVTRSIDLGHNLSLHPDEPVFYTSANNLMLFIFGKIPSYNVVKPYPEGAYAFQLPFHILCKGINTVFGCEISSQIAGRLSSLIYYALGFLVAAYLLFKHFNCEVKTLIVYGSLLVFSIIHIEQSRYGTGDPISFFLLMLIILFSANACIISKHRRLDFFIAFVLCGMISAVKYPLLFFSLIPFSILWRTKERIWMSFVSAFLIIIGFLIISPQIWKDPSFLLKTIELEKNAYMINGNITEIGGFNNHFLSVGLYFLLYSGVLVAPYYSFIGIRQFQSQSSENNLRFLLFCVVPSLSVLFCAYNLFTKTIFLRTFYPFFCIMDIYAAIGISKCLTWKKWKTVMTWIFLIVTIARGGFYIAVLSENYGAKYLEEISLQATDSFWNQTIFMSPGYLLPIDESKYTSVQHGELSQCEEIREIDRGTLFISHGLEFGRGSPYILSVHNEKANEYITRWTDFKKANSEYYIGAVYPRFYYYLFGYWIKGTTGTSYEFPTNYVYYH